ncbi:MAG: hypothetical protein U9Q97_07780 [Acidobacteriota bacterium]|nr:hypothetical protein [Acidobacteriota bacterium]
MFKKIKLFIKVMVLIVTVSLIFSMIVSAQEYTGVIIDAIGLKADSVLYPEILTIDEEGNKQPVYTLLMADPALCEKIGLVQYTDTLEEAKQAARVGANPYIVKVKELIGTALKGNFIISFEDARKIRGANKISNFLPECRVAIVIGEPDGTGRSIIASTEGGGSKVYNTTEMVGGLDYIDYKRNMAVAFGEGTIPQNAPDAQTGRIMAKEEARLVAEAGLIRLLEEVQISAETTSEIAEKHYLTRNITEKLEGFLKGASMTTLKYVTNAKTGELEYVLIGMQVPLSTTVNALLVPIHKDKIYRIYEFSNPNY